LEYRIAIDPFGIQLGMKVVLYGASGTIGSRILRELLARGHAVTAVVRDPAKISEPQAVVRAGNVLDPASVAATAAGADAAISAFAPPADDPPKVIEATRSLVAGLKKAGVSRFLMVGGAGSLRVATGEQLVDLPDFPPAWQGIALAHRDALDVLRQSGLDWTSFSPPALIEPGERTGEFRLGKDDLVADAKGESRISAEDYAIAMVDELENPRHVRQRFTIGY
jgi:putative NADH-flavin reductase